MSKTRAEWVSFDEALGIGNAETHILDDENSSEPDDDRVYQRYEENLKPDKLAPPRKKTPSPEVDRRSLKERLANPRTKVAARVDAPEPSPRFARFVAAREEEARKEKARKTSVEAALALGLGRRDAPPDKRPRLATDHESPRAAPAASAEVWERNLALDAQGAAEACGMSSDKPEDVEEQAAAGWQRVESKSSPGTFYFFHAATGRSLTAVPVAELRPLPAVWERRESRSRPGTFYYFCQQTGATQTERPIG